MGREATEREAFFAPHTGNLTLNMIQLQEEWLPAGM